MTSGKHLMHTPVPDLEGRKIAHRGHFNFAKATGGFLRGDYVLYKDGLRVFHPDDSETKPWADRVADYMVAEIREFETHGGK